MRIQADYLIFGAGIYGLYAAKILANRGYKIIVIECDNKPFQRASYINQARVHNGYHYPRSVSTAKKSAKYYQRFNNEFYFAINKHFKKIYAISAKNSYTNAEQFKKFCDYINIPATEIHPDRYFQKYSTEAAFETEEFSYDADKISVWFTKKLLALNNVSLFFNTKAKKARVYGNNYRVLFENDLIVEAPTVLNATYASINQINELFGVEKFSIKYEMCEIILIRTNRALDPLGITVMDGPFFSIMPFGLGGLHSLTSVTFTPHQISYSDLPDFPCQKHNSDCSITHLKNCNFCIARPTSAYPFMNKLARKYLVPELDFNYVNSLFAIKSILMTSELDDSRPTIIRKFSESPAFISVLSGKFNTIYDLEDFLE